MGKNFSADENYSISPAAAFERHIDEAFLNQKFEALGARDISVDVARDGDAVTVTVDRKMDIDVPGFAKKVVKPTNDVHLVEEWRPDGDGYICDWHAKTSPAPSKLSGTRTLSAAAGGVNDRTDGSIEVKVPIIGGKLSDWLSGEARSEVEAELAWLKEQHG